MSSAVTNRVYLPESLLREHPDYSPTIYCSDDVWGDERMRQLYAKYGNLKVEACPKGWGKSLDDMNPFWTGTIYSFFEGACLPSYPEEETV